MNKTTGQELFEKEKRLSEYDGSDRIVSSHELAKDLANIKDSDFIIPTGVVTFDRLHKGGVEAGELIVVTGPTGEGKTTWLMSVTKNMIKNDVQSAWFTLEVTPRQFMKKIAHEENVPLFYLPRENRENELWWIEERIIEAKVKHDIKVVFIDHLHQIFSMAKMNGNVNLSMEIGDMVAKIKNMAIQHNLVIFLIAHSKDDPSGSTREPRKEDIRDSGLISRLSDTIVGVWRVPNNADIDKTRRQPVGERDTKSKVRVFKNRREGKLGVWFMDHDNHYLSEPESEF